MLLLHHGHLIIIDFFLCLNFFFSSVSKHLMTVLSCADIPVAFSFFLDLQGVLMCFCGTLRVSFLTIHCIVCNRDVFCEYYTLPLVIVAAFHGMHFVVQETELSPRFHNLLINIYVCIIYYTYT